ncbi:MAG: hypothetical protein ACTSR7_19715 [Promethearchaeota archaeon]
MAHANNDIVQVKIKTLAIERANTIAIFDASSNDFTGHFQEKERTTVFQLYLNTDTTFDGTPFVVGPNAIVISTSLFTKTELHGYIEHDRLDETPLYSEEEGMYEFYSVDRDGNKLEDACGDSDFHIVRFDISAEEAMEILSLLLNCLIDEETNETALLYSYISTKNDGISASMMNLPSAAMTFIPLYSPYASAALGAAPRPFDPLAWFLGGLITFIITIYFGSSILLVTAIIIIVVITTQNNDNAQSIGMTILTWLAHLAWLLVRAAILVFAWIVFAIILLITTIGFGVLCLFLMLLNVIVQGQLQLNINFLKIQRGNNFISLEYIIESEYIEFFDIMIPTIRYRYEVNDSPYDATYNLYKNDYASPSVEFCDTLQEIGSQPLEFNDLEDLEEFFNGVGYAMILFGSIVSITGIILTLSKSSPYKSALAIGTLIVAGISLSTSTILFLGYIDSIGGLTENFMQGLAIGSLINMIMGALLIFGGLAGVAEIVIHLMEIIFIGFAIREDIEAISKYNISSGLFEYPTLFLALVVYGLTIISFKFVDEDLRLLAGLLFAVIAGGIGVFLWTLLFP